MFKKLLVIPAVLLGLSLSGCGLVSVTDANHMDHGMMGEESGFSSSDIMFAQMMIPHHQQAVDMGTLAESRAKDPRVRAIAAQIKAEQAPEILQMKAWLKASGSQMDMGHDMGMNGMLTDSELVTLTNSTGSIFDHLYLTGMIGHHEGAIEMAQMVLGSNNAEAKALGQSIVKSQTEQISYLKELLAQLK
jgi:uncharacterized protein (DUF305 family)